MDVLIGPIVTENYAAAYISTAVIAALVLVAAILGIYVARVMAVESGRGNLIKHTLVNAAVAVSAAIALAVLSKKAYRAMNEPDELAGVTDKYERIRRLNNSVAFPQFLIGIIAVTTLVTTTLAYFADNADVKEQEWYNDLFYTYIAAAAFGAISVAVFGIIANSFQKTLVERHNLANKAAVYNAMGSGLGSFFKSVSN
jgi:hypothetical protein